MNREHLAMDGNDAQDAEHARQRLVELKDDLKLTQRAMADALSVEPSYLSRLLYPPGKAGRKNLGSGTIKAARKAFNLQADWFELPLGSALPSQGKVQLPLVLAEPKPTAHVVRVAPLSWPFKLASYKRLQELKSALGPKVAAEAIRDLDQFLDLAITRWEHRVKVVKKNAAK